MSRQRWFLGFALSGLGLWAPGLSAQGTCAVVEGQFQRIWSGLNQNVFALHSSSPAAWTSEDGGRIRFTNDGGAHWNEQTTPPCVQDVLRSSHFLHNGPIRRGWAVGDGGVVLTTGTAGNTWTQIAAETALGEPAELWDVYFLDTQLGFLGGNHLLRRSEDGGIGWSDVTVVHPGNPGFDIADAEIYSVDFVVVPGGYIGLAAAEPGLILRTDHTSDSKIWTVVYDFCLAPPLCPACVPTVAASCGGTAAKFELWDIEFNRTFSDPTKILAVASGGFANQCGQFLVSEDSGLTWAGEYPANHSCNTAHTSGSCAITQVNDAVPTQYGTHVPTNGAALSVGYAGTIFLRDPTCDPAVWRAKPQILGPNGPFSQPFLGVDGNGTGTAWITALMNGLFKTVDGGQNWVTQSVGNDVMRLNNLYFQDALNGWAVGQFFRVTRTTDGGFTWTDQAYAAGAGRLRDIEFNPGATHGVTVGGYYDGSGALQLRYSDDGGASWSDAQVNGTLPATGKELRTVVWNGGSDFWTVGASGVVLYSVDHGKTWDYTPVDLGAGAIADADLQSVGFLDADNGFVVGSRAGQGRIYRVGRATNPALRTWTEVSPPASAGVVEFLGVAARGAVAYAVGQKLVAGELVGTIYQWNGTGFVEVTGLPAVAPCGSGIPQIWTEVALAPTGHGVFVGGACGRFLRFDGTVWQELKSHTSMTFSGLFFYSDTEGFLHAHLGSHGIIVKYHQVP